MKSLVCLGTCMVLAFIGSAAAFDACGTAASFPDLQRVGSRFQIVAQRGREAGPKYGAMISCRRGTGRISGDMRGTRIPPIPLSIRQGSPSRVATAPRVEARSALSLEPIFNEGKRV